MYILNASYNNGNFITKGDDPDDFSKGIILKDNYLKRMIRTIPDNVIPPNINLDWVHCTASYNRVQIVDSKEEYIKAFFKSISNTNISLNELILEDRIYVLNTLGKVPDYVNCSLFCLYPIGGKDYKISNELECIRILMKYSIFVKKERTHILWLGVLYILARKIVISYLVDRYITPKTGDPEISQTKSDIDVLTNEFLDLMLKHESFPLEEITGIIKKFGEMDELYIRI